MAVWPVVLRMYVDDRTYAKKIGRAVENLPGVQSVWASPEQGLVVVHGTADAWALRRRIWCKLNRHAEILSDGSAPYYYGSSESYGYCAADPDPYGYAAFSTVPTCSIL